MSKVKPILRGGWGAMSEPTLKKIKDIMHEGAIITIYEASNGDIVLGGIGWFERFDWEKTNWPEDYKEPEDDDVNA